MFSVSNVEDTGREGSIAPLSLFYETRLFSFLENLITASERTCYQHAFPVYIFHPLHSLYIHYNLDQIHILGSIERASSVRSRKIALALLLTPHFNSLCNFQCYIALLKRRYVLITYFPVLTSTHKPFPLPIYHIPITVPLRYVGCHLTATHAQPKSEYSSCQWVLAVITAEHSPR